MARNLLTNVIIGGSTTAGFDSLSSKILALGQIFNQVGGQVGEWEKESVETFKNYETYMLEAKGAMSANYDSASQLEREYNALQEKAQEWAGSTIFHTNDVAKAISEAAHAGWDYEKMLQGIPTSMLLAQAGNTDLSTGLDMLIKTINGTGTAFSDSEKFVNQWVMAANSSATTVSELGEAMEKMGATARFGDSTAELLTMLGVLANTGTVGSAAGTLLRNSMIRLIAPTKNAREAMEGLGVEADEINEAVSGDSDTLAEVNTLLTEAGFSAYNSAGKLKPFLTTFKDLYNATKLMTPEQRNKVLSAIFPTRTITGAMALLQAASENYNGLLDKILDSEGYAAKVAGIQTSGLMGSEELFKSKWEEFSRKIGEILSGPIEDAHSLLGGFIDTLNGASPELLAAITGAATAIGTMGPGLMSLGLAMKLLGNLGGTGIAIMTTAIGVGMLSGYLYEINKLSLENNFGDMAVNLGAINEAMKGAREDLKAKTEDFKAFSDAAKKAVETYKSSGQELVENLWSKMVTDSEITPDEQITINKQAEKYIGALKEAIAYNASKNISIANLIYGEPNENGEYKADPNDPMYAGLVQMIGAGMDLSIEEARNKSAELRAAITSAFEDGKLSPEELQGIQDLMNQIDSLIEGINPNEIGLRKMLLKSRSTSLDTMKDFSNSIDAMKEEALADLDDQSLDLIAEMQLLYEKAVKEGKGFFDPYTNQWVEDASQVDMDKWVADLLSDWDAKKTELGAEWDDAKLKGWQNALQNNIETGELFKQAQAIMEGVTSGQYDTETAKRLMGYLEGDYHLMGESIRQMMEFYGGADGMAELIASYRNLAEKTKFQNKKEEYTQTADWLESMVRLYDILTGDVTDAQEMVEKAPESAKATEGMMEALKKYVTGEGMTEEGLQSVFQGLTDEQRESWNKQVENYQRDFDLQAIVNDFFGPVGGAMGEWLATYLLNNGLAFGEDYTYDKTGGEKPRYLEQPEVQESYGAQTVRIAPYAEGQDALASLEDQGVTVNVEGDTQSLEAKIAAEDGQELMSYVDGDASDLHYKIIAEDGQTLEENVTGNASQLAAIIESYNGKTITVNIRGNKLFNLEKYAEGGRADSPSIFGDAGAEWAIPEEHTQRTADLLNAAREASGFTWGELLERNGGLNAGGGNINVNISSYAPVIHANDAAGVAEELAKDKARLGEIVKKAVRTAMEEMSMKEGIEVYA